MPTLPQDIRIKRGAGFVHPEQWGDWEQSQKEHHNKLIEKKRVEYLEECCKATL